MTPEPNCRFITVLDGGFSTQLGCHLRENGDGDPLWTAKFLATHPEDIINTHLDFLRAGAEMILTNTYQASIEGFTEFLKVTREEGIQLIYMAVELAKKARDIFLEEYPDAVIKPLVVGSVGPYGAHLHDASEFTGKYADYTSIEMIREWHRPRIEALVDAGVDLLALETIPCQAEAEMLVELLKDYPHMKAWLSFSCKDDQHISHGENFQEVAAKCWDINPEQLVAIGVNCLRPSFVKKLITGINDGREYNKIPLIVYPNSGEKYDRFMGWIGVEKSESLEDFVVEWLELGVTFVGGCCRTYAADISRIRMIIHKWMNKQNNMSINN